MIHIFPIKRPINVGFVNGHNGPLDVWTEIAITHLKGIARYGYRHQKGNGINRPEYNRAKSQTYYNMPPHKISIVICGTNVSNIPGSRFYRPRPFWLILLQSCMVHFYRLFRFPTLGVLTFFYEFWLCSETIDISLDYGRNCRKPLIFYGCFFAASDFLIKRTIFEPKSGINWQKLKFDFLRKINTYINFPKWKIRTYVRFILPVFNRRKLNWNCRMAGMAHPTFWPSCACRPTLWAGQKMVENHVG